MTNKTLGEKHECPECGVKFYDLGKPPKCPACGHDSNAAAKSTDGKKENAEDE